MAKSCGCCVLTLVAILFLVALSLVVGFSLYLAVVTNFLSKTPLMYVISGNFKVVSGDNFSMRLLNQTSVDYERKSARYESILQHILEKSAISDSVLKSEVYSFRKGSLIVFFRVYASKSRLDSLLDIQSKAVITLGAIESVYMDESAILSKLRDVVRGAFRASKSYLSETQSDIVIDADSVKIGHIDQLIEHFRLDKQAHKESEHNVNSHKWTNGVPAPHGHSLVEQQSKLNSSPADAVQWLPVSSTTVRPVVSAIHSTVSLQTERPNFTVNAQSTASGGTDKIPINTTSVNINDNGNESTATDFPNLTKQNLNETNKSDASFKLDINSQVPLKVAAFSKVANQSIAYEPKNVTKGNKQQTAETNGTQLHDSSTSPQVIHSKSALKEQNGLKSTTNKTQAMNGNGSDIKNTQESRTTSPIVNNKLAQLNSSQYEKHSENNSNVIGQESNEFSLLLGISLEPAKPAVDLHNEDHPRVESREENEAEFIETTTVLPEQEELSTISVKVNNKVESEVNWNLPENVRPHEPISNISQDESVDGFAISANSNQVNNETEENNASPVSQLPNRVLVAAEDSFDLYTLPDYNRTEHHIGQLNSVKLLSGTPITSSTANKSMNGHEHGDNEFVMDEPQEEEFHLYSSTVDGANFGKRISKKLEAGSSKFDEYAGNSLHHGTGHHLKESNNVSHDLLTKLSIGHNKTHHKDQLEERWSTTESPTTTLEPIFECEDNEFACRISGECIPIAWKCNQHVECEDRSDEMDCLCVDYLKQDESHRHKICDGLLDCEDQSDELNCPSCSEHMFVCAGHQSQCINMSLVCNGETDCHNGEDEQNCISLATSTELANVNTIGEHYNPNGILFIRHRGHWGPLCFDNYDNQIDNEVRLNSSVLQVDDMGKAVCKANYFSQLESIDLVPMESRQSLTFYSISRNISTDRQPTLSLWSSLFERSQCTQGKVARIECSNLECGIRPVSSKLRRRIIGGQNSFFGEWPWQVALYREGDFQCGGVLIDSQWLLTAAHCFYTSPNAYWSVRAGVLRRGNLIRSYHEQIRRIERVIIHPEYVDKGFLNDIALLKLEQPLRFSKYVRAICLPGEGDDVNNWHNQLCTTVGWGKLYEHGRIFPDTLQEVKLPIISSEECRKRTLFLPLYKITDNMFCAGFERGGRDACLGDSGGPMMCQRGDGKWLLLGITSNGDGCGRANRPGVYTKVANYLAWIRNTTATVWPYTTTSQPECLSHRCPLGKCLRQEQICDNTIDCIEDRSDEMDCK